MLVAWLVLCGLFGSLHTAASHLIGGYITCTCLGADGGFRDYRVTLVLLRDCAGVGAPFDNPVQIGIYNRFNDAYHFARLATATHGVVEEIEPAQTCGEVPPSVCIETTSYEFIIEDLPVITDEWLISWQRCCRPGDLANMTDPASTGSAVFTTISPQAQSVCNSSPSLHLDQLPYILCTDQSLQFPLGATDPDGDRLEFRFASAYVAGGVIGSPDVPGDPSSCDGLAPDPTDCLPPFDAAGYTGPFSPEFPLAGDPAVSIDSVQNTIVGVATLPGRYVVGLEIREFRNDTLLGILRAELTTLVTVCQEATFDVIDEIVAPSGPGQEDGAIMLMVAGGSPPYTYQWLPALSDSANLTGIGE
ncbi:MAG: SprB repeat-containing protein, partial [Saprospiraceae bacterium]|nr:SprB repeat-containing protein [Saprospiraceae bacterium]